MEMLPSTISNNTLQDNKIYVYDDYSNYSIPNYSLYNRINTLENTINELSKTVEELQHKFAFMMKYKKTRDEVVEMAEKEIRMFSFNPLLKNTFVDFIINERKRTTVAILKDTTDNSIIKKVKTVCVPDDTFNEDIGKIIVLYKVYGQKVPEIYTTLPS